MTPFYNANVNTRGMLVISTEPSLSLVNEQRRLGLLQQPSSLYPFPSDVEVYMQAVEACPIEGQKDAVSLMVRTYEMTFCSYFLLVSF